MTSPNPRPTAEQAFARTEERILAAVEAGHEMDGMALTDEDRAAVRRIARGETTGNDEVATLLAAIRDRQPPATS
ncbi:MULTISPECIES: antitoxin VbhA family protein [Actinomycetes]|uniref:antitoxin VbhA family protein n=1 Tax=Actinomycetes TaxID=1760 RepID=UPI0006896A88|nr:MULTISPECIES: antitoxin VbhA family protein [Actinomycetes]